MILEKLTDENLTIFTELTIELWTDCQLDEEMEFYRNLIHSENDACFLLKDQLQAIAFIHVSIRHDSVEGAKNSPIAYLEGIFVKPDYRKNGLGKRLVQEVENWVRSKGIRQLASDSPIWNIDSIKFHSKSGFQESDRIVCFIKDS